ncbi:hypothetical protein FDP41_003759 [Naegleria fowleri]|uniref:Uncharacterized protein n=1 Tax=Naegleria fowleri TaxID=5763 RepID=A0A6A5BPY7_NAEFO|nr:uncharacterized protein FDP41_003759 [Naegleria fowleri]KAF0977106.1 hypothetical protein FDP41_003759 [Naegleria fowleri]
MLPAVIPSSELKAKKRKETHATFSSSLSAATTTTTTTTTTIIGNGHEDPIWGNISFITLECYHVPSSHVVQDACNKKAERSNREEIMISNPSSSGYRFEMKTRVPKKTQNFKQIIKQLRIYWVVGTEDFYPGITFGTELFFPNNRDEFIQIIKTHVDDWTTSDRVKKYHVKVNGKNFILQGLDKVFKANKSYPLHEMLDHTSKNHVESFKGRDLYKMYLDYDDLSILKVDLIQSNVLKTNVQFLEEDGDTDSELSIDRPSKEKKEMTTKKKKLSTSITKLIASSECEDESFIQLVASLVKYENVPKDGIGKYGTKIELLIGQELPRAAEIIENSTCVDYEFLKLAIELRMNDLVPLHQFYSYVAKCFIPSQYEDNRNLWYSCDSNLKMTW